MAVSHPINYMGSYMATVPGQSQIHILLPVEYSLLAHKHSERKFLHVHEVHHQSRTLLVVSLCMSLESECPLRSLIAVYAQGRRSQFFPGYCSEFRPPSLVKLDISRTYSFHAILGELTMTIRILHLGSMAPLVHHLVPLMIYESPCLYKECIDSEINSNKIHKSDMTAAQLTGIRGENNKMLHSDFHHFFLG